MPTLAGATPGTRASTERRAPGTCTDPTASIGAPIWSAAGRRRGGGAAPGAPARRGAAGDAPSPGRGGGPVPGEWAGEVVSGAGNLPGPRRHGDAGLAGRRGRHAEAASRGAPRGAADRHHEGHGLAASVRAATNLLVAAALHVLPRASEGESEAPAQQVQRSPEQVVGGGGRVDLILAEGGKPADPELQAPHQ